MSNKRKLLVEVFLERMFAFGIHYEQFFKSWSFYIGCFRIELGRARHDLPSTCVLFYNNWEDLDKDVHNE